mgnify:CR=1 FL=1
MKTKRICWFSLVLVLFIFLFQVVNVYATTFEGFDYPIGIPNNIGWYDAQGFLTNDHLGEDWNKLCSNETAKCPRADENQPVYAIANGKVISYLTHEY